MFRFWIFIPSRPRRPSWPRPRLPPGLGPSSPRPPLWPRPRVPRPLTVSQPPRPLHSLSPSLPSLLVSPPRLPASLQVTPPLPLATPTPLLCTPQATPEDMLSQPPMARGAPCLLVTLVSSLRVRLRRATPLWPPWPPPPHNPSPRPPLSLPRAWEAILRPEVTQTIITQEVILRRLTVIEDLPEKAEDLLMTPGVLEVHLMMEGVRHLTMATEAGVVEATGVLRHAVVLLLSHEARLLHTGTLLTAGLRGRGGAITEADIEKMQSVENKLIVFISSYMHLSDHHDCLRCVK